MVIDRNQELNKPKRGRPVGWTNPRLKPTDHPTLEDIRRAAEVVSQNARIRRDWTLTVSNRSPECFARLRSLFGGSLGESTWGPYWLLSGPRARGFLMTVYALLSPSRQRWVRMLELKPREPAKMEQAA